MDTPPPEGFVSRLFRRSKRTEEQAGTGRDLLIVRGGLSPAFYFFCEAFAKEQGLAVVPDRRAEERRHHRQTSPAERRTNERRGAAPKMWEQGDFVVVSKKKPD
jgi:hypothetical protein